MKLLNAFNQAAKDIARGFKIAFKESPFGVVAHSSFIPIAIGYNTFLAVAFNELIQRPIRIFIPG